MMRRSCPSHEWRCASTKPGITMVFDASITCAPDDDLTWPSPPTPTIFLPSISTSPFVKLPTCGSMLMMVPPLRRMRPCAAASAAAGRSGAAAATANPAPALKRLRREIASCLGNLAASRFMGLPYHRPLAVRLKADTTYVLARRPVGPDAPPAHRNARTADRPSARARSG